MRVPVEAVLFVSINRISWRAMNGQEKGQYDLRIAAKSEIGAFFESVPTTETTDLGGWLRNVPIQAFDGPEPVPARTVPLRYGGPQSGRKDYYFPSQKAGGDRAYPLWSPVRVTGAVGRPYEEIEGALALIVRDIHGGFHARWVPADKVGDLPEALQERIVQEGGKGVYEVAEESGAVSARASEVVDALTTHHNVLLYGPPGTGKTHLVQEVVRSFGGLTLDTAAEHDFLVGGDGLRWLWVTFHQSYSYEDFIVGLRPKPLPTGGFTLEPVAGTLLELSEWIRQPGHRALLVIDEINRGNVSRIFGELITLLEVDKRLSADGSEAPTTVQVRLPYVGSGAGLSVTLPDGTKADVPNPFTLPRDLYVLATMNSVDTSVAPLDAALRRRFEMVHLTPDLAEIADHLGLASPLPALDPALPNRVAICVLGIRVLDRLNRGIAMFLGAEFQFGHWYLVPLAGTVTTEGASAALADIWRNVLLPQLVEHFAGRSEQLLAVLGDPTDSPALRVETPDPAWGALGAATLVAPRATATDADVIDLLRGIGTIAP